MFLNSPTSCGFESFVDDADDAISPDGYQARSLMPDGPVHSSLHSSMHAEPVYVGPHEEMDNIEIEFSAMSLPEEENDPAPIFSLSPPTSMIPISPSAAVAVPSHQSSSAAFTMSPPSGTPQPRTAPSNTFALSPSAGVAMSLPNPPPAAFQPHFGDHPSRTLYVQHAAVGMLTIDEIQQLFGQFGDIRAVFTECASQGYVLVSYYDIRHAKAAVRRLSGFRYRNIRLDIHYSIPVGIEALQNQGTIVVFNLDPASTNEELARLFGDYGELKEIRETPNKKHHKFIEFFDVRHADAAMAGLNKREIRGKRIKIEPSRPGGARRNMVQRVQPSPRPSVQARPGDGVLPRWDH
ncbi:RNA recognition motif [Carpediemonas membranifera]|uniref:RNA recognition motif n=1 Tax=Carpediemonas membranifera TaxID=201153 RepID=A0A8J6BH00_9EUKA|nr:RNA recognition motif [Carpediemonas membranifera]|eukprot:KAG9397287.1 RNA recognition motif [Carpediemonas membranifera]